MATGIGQRSSVFKRLVSKESERIEYLDIAKGIGIILVIMGHTGFLTETLKTYVFSFHMPLFFVISGMLMCLKGDLEKDKKEIFKKKARSFLIPYFWFSLIYVIIYIITYNIGLTSKADFIQSVIYMFTFYGDSTLWFLPTLLIAECGYYLLGRKLKGVVLLLISLVVGLGCHLIQFGLSILKAMNISNLLITNVIDFGTGILRGGVALTFVAIGYHAFEELRDRSYFYGDQNPSKTRIKYTIFGVILLALAFASSRLNVTVDFHRMELGYYSFFFITSLLGSFGILGISYGIRSFLPLSFYGKNSLIIMCSHLNFYILFAAIQWAWLVDTIVTRAKSYVFMFNIVLATLVLETILIFIINRFCPFIIGKKNEKSSK